MDIHAMDQPTKRSKDTHCPRNSVEKHEGQKTKGIMMKLLLVTCATFHYTVPLWTRELIGFEVMQAGH